MREFLDYTGLSHFKEKVDGEIEQLSLKLPWGEIIGNNNTLVSHQIYGLIPGRQYYLMLPNPNWDKTGVTYGGGYSQFEICSLDSSDTRTIMVQIKLNQSVVNGYVITIPSDSAYMEIRLRATSGVGVTFYFEDLQYATEADDTAILNEIAYNSLFIASNTQEVTTNGVTFTRLSRNRVKLNGTASIATNFNLWGAAGSRYRVKANGFSAMVRCADPSSFPSGLSVIFTYFKSDSTTGGSGNIVSVPNKWYVFPSSELATHGRPYIHVAAGTTIIDLEIELVSSDYNLATNLQPKMFNATYHTGATDFTTKCQQFSSLLLGDTVNNVEAPADCESFLFFTDPHLLEFSDYESEMYEFIAQIQKYYNSTPTTFCLCGGDWLGNSDLPGEACFKLGYINGFMHSMFKDCVMLVGNHDTNYQGKKDAESAKNTTRLSAQSIVDLWYRREGKCYFKYKGANTTFYCFDTGTENQTLAAYDNYGWEQATWFANSLLTDDSSHIAIAAHILYYSGTSIQPLTSQILAIAQAYNDRTSISVNGVSYDYSAKNGKVEFEISGHLHADNVVTINDIPCILTTHVRANVDLGPTFDLVLADYTNRKVHLIRVGSGSDRVVNLNQ